MIILEVGNSTSKISCLTSPQFKELRTKLSYKSEIKSFYGRQYGGQRTYLINAKGEFPTGLLSIVKAWLQTPQHKPNVILDNRRIPKTASKGGMFSLLLRHTPYLEQQEAATACLEASRGIICMPTGTGKSLVCALIINSLQLKTLIVVPSLELKRQLTDTMVKLFGKEVMTKKLITVDNIDALDSSHEETRYDCLIIDEFHHSASKTYQKLNKKCWNNIFYRFGLTATPWRTDKDENILLTSILESVIYKLSYNTAIAKKYIVPVEAYYYDLPKTQTKSTTWANVYKDLIVNNAHRNATIAQLLTNLNNSKVYTLCLVKQIEHGNILKAATKIPFANGEEDNAGHLISKFNSKGLNSLIGTSGVLGEGVDTVPAEFVILTGLGKSKGQFMQMVGRGVRKCENKASCKIILFRDSSHKWTLQHFNAQVKYLREEYGIVPVKLEKAAS